MKLDSERLRKVLPELVAANTQNVLSRSRFLREITRGVESRRDRVMLPFLNEVNSVSHPVAEGEPILGGSIPGYLILPKPLAVAYRELIIDRKTKRPIK